LWLPVADDYRKVNTSRQLADPYSILNLYRRLLAYRKATPALQWGSYQPIDNMPEACLVYLRQAEGELVLIALNFSDQEQKVTLPVPGESNIVVSTYLDREGVVSVAELVLRGDEGVILEPSGPPRH
jgi:alpha-glucosidase